jgi:chromosome segregation ATPase
MSEHLTYLREVLEHDAIGFGEDFQFQDAVEHFEALEHASEQYRKAMSEQAKRIEQLEAALRPFAAAADTLDKEGWDNLHIEGSNADVTGEHCRAARAALEGKD